MKRILMTLVATAAAFAAAAGAAFGADPVQSATQSSSTGQASYAASSATQVQPSNQNISVRVLSPGNDGSVSQSNTAASSATAANAASTGQTARQSLAGGCGCAASPVQSAAQTAQTGQLGTVLSAALQAAAANGQAPASVASPGSGGATSQSNGAASSGTAANLAPTSQAATQSAASGGGVQSSTQDSSTSQSAGAASSATQDHPSNSNISVRVLSPGNGGAVSQSNTAASSATAANLAPTSQGSSQTGGGSGVQSSTQSADTTQQAIAASSAKQDHPSNSNISVRVLSPGNDGSVSQSNVAASSATAANAAPVRQLGSQSQAGSACGCGSTGPSVQALGQASSIDQLAGAASSATQTGASNVSDPIRIDSAGNGGSLTQSNATLSSALAANLAPVEQSGVQTQAGSECGCSYGPSVQVLGQSSEIGQSSEALSSADQIGATNESGPIRIGSDGNDGAVTQSNVALSEALAANAAPTSQTGMQTQSGSGVQALGQDSGIFQEALAGSAVRQLPGRSECGCGSSFGNSADPIRISSDGNDGSLTQGNIAASAAVAANLAAPTQMGMQTQSSPSCGCSGLGVQALGQESAIEQLSEALSSTLQAGASNASGPVRIGSAGGGGSTSQWNSAASLALAPNFARLVQAGQQLMV
jgi:hypothetical protein